MRCNTKFIERLAADRAHYNIVGRRLYGASVSRKSDIDAMVMVVHTLSPEDAV